MDIKIKFDKKAVDHVMGRISPKNLERVLNKGLNAAAASAKKQCVSAIFKEYNLKKKAINVGVRVRRARPSSPTASVSVVAWPIPLDRFNPTQVKSGLSVKVSRSGGAELIPSAFLQNIKGKQMAMIRTSAISGRARKYVVMPSSKAPHRGAKGQGLPMNRLWADPMANIIEPIANKIAEQASHDGTVKMLVEVENLLDKGKG